MDKLVYTYGEHKIYWSKINKMYLLESRDQNGLWSNSMDVLIDEIHRRDKNNYEQLSLFKGDDVNG